MSPAVSTVAPFPRVLEELMAAERADGWLARCEEAGRHVALSEPLVEALAAALRTLGRPALEICAGDGALARALAAQGVPIVATDADPPGGDSREVERLTADEALRRHRPTVVLGSFVPVDSGVDRRVLWDPSVRHYVVLNARLSGALGPDLLWTLPGWARTPLPEVTRWLLTRHDVWLGGSRVLKHGEGWLLTREGDFGAGAR